MTHPAPTLTKKLCLLGATAVGKTSLVQRYVQGSFNEAYRETIGVNIHSMDVPTDARTVRLLIWDIEGLSDPMQRYREDYLLGAHGYVLVIDPTRTETLDIARSLADIADGVLRDTPFVALLNKADLKSRWEVRPAEIDTLSRAGWTLFETSAKTGANVREAFSALTAAMVAADRALARAVQTAQRH